MDDFCFTEIVSRTYCIEFSILNRFFLRRDAQGPLMRQLVG